MLRTEPANLHLLTGHGLKRLQDSVDLKSFDRMVNFNVQQLESALMTGIDSGILRPENLTGKIVDFGCGRGVSTAVFNLFGADVTGVELSSDMVNKGRELSFVPHNRILNTDGIKYLNSLPAGSLDMVNASMLGPDIDGNLCRNFLNACKHAVNPKGVILVTSDMGTLTALEKNNTIGNGFVRNGVFMAVRGLDSLFSFPAFDTSGFDPDKARQYKNIIGGLDLSKFRLVE